MRSMKISFISVFVAGLILLPSTAWPQAQEGASDLPQVAQPLVREGDFAIKLVEALKMGTAEDEAQAESMLVTAGIEPRNGWISDYPVTPDVIGELQHSIISAADSGKLAIPKDDAVYVFQGLCVSLGLAIVADTSGADSGNEPVTGLSQYNTPAVVNNYYYDYGPPVVTYYAPPWDYYYLYSWVPYPFWSGRFFFSGFYCLRNFNKTVVVKSRHKTVTNRVYDKKIHRVVRIDPARRGHGEFIKTDRISPRRGFRSPEARKGAEGILARSVERQGDQGTVRSLRNPGLRGKGMSSFASERRLKKRTPARELGRLPENPGGASGSVAAFRGGKSPGRHVVNPSRAGRRGTGTLGSHGMSRDLIGGAGTSRSKGFGKDFRSQRGNAVWSNSSRESRGAARAFGNRVPSRGPAGGKSDFRSQGASRDFRSGRGNSAGSSASRAIRGGGRGTSSHGGSATKGRGRCVGRC